MTLTLSRMRRSPDGIVGALLTPNEHIAFTLEHYYPDLKGGAKVPLGTYECVKGIHRLSSGKILRTFEVMNVPGHTGILFHPGNGESDSEGCILLGDFAVNSRLIDSRKGFSHFMLVVGRFPKFNLKVIDEA